jgi:hypothetical protein
MSSRWVGALSISSSVRLKSPSIMSGHFSLFDLLVVLICSQKSVCSFLSFGAYTFRRVISLFLCHLKLMANALPSISTVVSRSSTSIRFLLITMATPTEALRLAESCEFIIVSLLSKHMFIAWDHALSRWVSCTARMAILFSFIIWYIADLVLLWLELLVFSDC